MFQRFLIAWVAWGYLRTLGEVSSYIPHPLAALAFFWGMFAIAALSAYAFWRFWACFR